MRRGPTAHSVPCHKGSCGRRFDTFFEPERETPLAASCTVSGSENTRAPRRVRSASFRPRTAALRAFDIHTYRPFLHTIVSGVSRRETALAGGEHRG
eukprot:248925-Prymnesium_polylepis.3